MYQARTCFSPAVGEGDSQDQAIEAMLKVMLKPSYPIESDTWTIQVLTGEGPLNSLKAYLISIRIQVKLDYEGRAKIAWAYTQEKK